MLTYGFYNSLNGDRKYNAEQMSSIFDGIIEDGVYSNVGEALMVVPGTGLQVIVKTGRAWFKHTWTLNDAWLPVDLEVADPLRSRIDSVVLEVNSNLDVRENSIKIIKGTPMNPAVPPTMIHEDGVDQYRLADITVEASATSISEENIANKIGMDDTPFVICPLESIDISDLFQQWEGQFDSWFDNLKEQLTDNVVTNLQHQIDERVKISDKATSEDIRNGTPGKWVDSELSNKEMSTIVSGLKVGDIVYSMRDLEEETDGRLIKCDQRTISKNDYPELASLPKILCRREDPYNNAKIDITAGPMFINGYIHDGYLYKVDVNANTKISTLYRKKITVDDSEEFETLCTFPIATNIVYIKYPFVVVLVNDSSTPYIKAYRYYFADNSVIEITVDPGNYTNSDWSFSKNKNVYYSGENLEIYMVNDGSTWVKIARLHFSDTFNSISCNTERFDFTAINNTNYSVNILNNVGNYDRQILHDNDGNRYIVFSYFWKISSSNGIVMNARIFKLGDDYQTKMYLYSIEGNRNINLANQSSMVNVVNGYMAILQVVMFSGKVHIHIIKIPLNQLENISSVSYNEYGLTSTTNLENRTKIGESVYYFYISGGGFIKIDMLTDDGPKNAGYIIVSSINKLIYGEFKNELDVPRFYNDIVSNYWYNDYSKEAGDYRTSSSYMSGRSMACFTDEFGNTIAKIPYGINYEYAIDIGEFIAYFNKNDFEVGNSTAQFVVQKKDQLVIPMVNNGYIATVDYFNQSLESEGGEDTQ